MSLVGLSSRLERAHATRPASLCDDQYVSDVGDDPRCSVPAVESLLAKWPLVTTLIARVPGRRRQDYL